MKPASERLLERVNQVTPESIGIRDAIPLIPLTPEVIADIKECISSASAYELKWGLSFAEAYLDSKPPQELLKWLLPMVPDWLTHQDWDVRERSLGIFIRLGDNYKNYRKIMLNMLRDPEAVVRWRALLNCQTFLTRMDIPVLLSFQNDDYITETEMGSPLIYAIRNDALAAIEDLCGRKFKKNEKVKPVEGTLMVYWWDWQPFLDWWEKHQGKRRFWDLLFKRSPSQQ